MSVLVEALSVIVKRSTLEDKYPGGVNQYIQDCPNSTFCADEYLTRVGFFTPGDVEHFVTRLTSHGLVFIKAEQFAEIAVVDQLKGCTVHCDWLHFMRHPDGYSLCWLVGTNKDELAVPPGWTPEQSRSLTFQEDTNDEQSLRFLRTEGNIDVFLDLRTGQEVYQGRTSREQGNPVEQRILQLNQLMGQYRGQSRYRDALLAVEEARALIRNHLGEAHPAYMNNLVNSAILAFEVGNHGGAGSLLREAWRAYQQIRGTPDPQFGMILHQMAEVCAMLGDYGMLECSLKEAVKVRRATLGEQHPDFHASLGSLLAFYVNTRNEAGASELMRQVGEILLGLNQQCEDMFKQGQYALALPIALRSYDLTRHYLGERHPSFAISLNNLGAVYWNLGRVVEAKPLLMQALDLTRETVGQNDPLYADRLSNLAALHLTAGDYALAAPLMSQALEIRRAVLGEMHPKVAVGSNNLASLYLSMGNYAAAESLYQQAAEIWRSTSGEDDTNYIGCQGSLGSLYYEMGDFDRAESLFRQVLDAIRLGREGEHSAAYGSGLSNLAAANLARGNLFEALSNMQQADGILRKELGEKDRRVVVNCNNQAQLYHKLGDYARAEPLYQRAIDTMRQMPASPPVDMADCLNNLADLCAATGNREKAAALKAEASTIYDQIIGQVFSVGTENQRMAYMIKIRKNFHSFLSLVIESASQTPEATKTIASLVLRRKGIVAESSATMRAAVLGGRYQGHRAGLEQLDALRARIAQASLIGPGGDPEAHQHMLAEWQAESERQEAQLVQQIPEMSLDQKLRTVDLQAIAGALPSDSALIEYIRFDLFNFDAVPAKGERPWQPAHYAALVLLAGDASGAHLVDLGDAKAIEWMLARYREAITGEAELDKRSEKTGPHRSVSDLGTISMNSDRATLRTALTNARHLRVAGAAQDRADGTGTGKTLRQALLDPLLPTIGNRTRLFIAPDGDLARLPFEMLLLADGRFLIESYEVSYLSTGRDMLRFEATGGGRTTESLVMADPDFDLGRSIDTEPGGGTPFQKLAGTRVEGQQIANLLEVTPLVGTQACEAPIKACRSPRILHIATHGFFLADQSRDPNEEDLGVGVIGGSGRLLSRLSLVENPLLRSGLALAGANTWLQEGRLPPEAEDGILTAQDVTGLDLLNTELAVLSACETGLGEVQVGEGVFGLRRAFALAGAKTLVMSLWKVPDQQTQELMVDFYRRILMGQPRASALRQAQLAMKEKYPDPRYWGAFICQGAPGPLV